jgi:hypothetical protein
MDVGLQLGEHAARSRSPLPRVEPCRAALRSPLPPRKSATIQANEAIKGYLRSIEESYR